MEREYLVIVHPAGQLDNQQATGFWTEVPALSACATEAETVDLVVARTRVSIAEWLKTSASDDLELRVVLAY